MCAIRRTGAARGSPAARSRWPPARHQAFSSRHHKSRNFCATCHDVSNPVLANLEADLVGDTTPDRVSERLAGSYFHHVERTWSEFTLSAIGVLGGASSSAEFRVQGAPNILTAARCQDCHMRGVPGKAADMNNAVL